MPIILQCESFPLTDDEVATMWRSVLSHTSFADEDIALQCVSLDEITRLNREYRGKDSPTNILTFSYTDDATHDIAMCMEVAENEARERGVALKEYVALLVVHGLLHVTGIDHEKSSEEASRMQELERTIVRESGFVPEALSDVY